MVLADTYRRQLHERALDQYGYVTTRDAEHLGVPPVELRKIAHRGGVEHVAYGLYRIEDVPRTGRDQFMEAVLRVGPEAYLTHDAVLALHDLGLVNPRRIKVGTPKRARPRLPESIEVIQQRLGPHELTVYEGIPSATVARALLDCRDLAMGERLVDATREAARRGLLRRSEAEQVLIELGASDSQARRPAVEPAVTRDADQQRRTGAGSAATAPSARRHDLGLRGAGDGSGFQEIRFPPPST